MSEEESVLKVLVELVDAVTEPLERIHEEFEEFESSIWDLTYAFSSLYIGYELLEHLIEPAEEFQVAQLALAHATGLGAEALQEFKEQGEKLAESFDVGGLESITAAQTRLYQVFRDQELTKTGTEWAVKLAQVLGVDAAMGARILTTAVQNLGVEGKTTEENMALMANKLTILQNVFPQSSAGAGRLAQDVSRLGAEAKAAGIPLNATLSLLATMNRIGIGGMRGPGMFASQLVQELTKVNEKGERMMTKIGAPLVFAPGGTHVNLIKTLEAWSKLDPNKLAAIEAHLPGQAAAIAQLVAHIDELKDSYNLLEKGTSDSNQATQTAADNAGTMKARVQELKNAVNDLEDALGTKLLPAITKVVNGLKGFVQFINEFATAHPTLTTVIVDLLGIAAATLTLVAGLGFLTKLAGFAWSGLNDLFGLTMLGKVWSMIGGMDGLILRFMYLREGALAASLAGVTGFLAWGAVLGVVALAVYEIVKHIEILRNALAGVHDFLREGFGSTPGGLFDKIWDLGLPTGSLEKAGALDARGGHTSLHYAPTINMPGGAGTQALKDVLENHSEDMMSKLEEQQRQQNRLTFRDTTRATAQ